MISSKRMSTLRVLSRFATPFCIAISHVYCQTIYDRLESILSCSEIYPHPKIPSVISPTFTLNVNVTICILRYLLLAYDSYFLYILRGVEFRSRKICILRDIPPIISSCLRGAILPIKQKC